MSLLKKWAESVESKDKNAMDDCLHDDYQFTLHSAGKVLSKTDIIEWGLSGDIIRKNVRILFENEKVGVEHSIVSFQDGNTQAVLAFCTFKDGKIFTLETGASNLPK